MPTLPTLTVTDAQANRMIAAFGDAAAYKAWLKQRVIEYVIDKEFQAEYTIWQNGQKAKAAQTHADLNSAS